MKMKRHSWILPCLLFCVSLYGADSKRLEKRPGEGHGLTMSESKLYCDVETFNKAIADGNSAKTNRLGSV